MTAPLKVAAVPTTDRPAPAWAVRLAHAIPLLLLPQCLWRLPFAFDYRMGMIIDEPRGWFWWTPLYVLGLSVVSEALALLSLGLVRWWGEVVPAWVPLLGGRRIPPYAAIVPATLGGIGATIFWLPSVLSWLGLADPGAGYEGLGWEILAKVCIAPGTLWGPLVLVLTVAYAIRRRRSR
ncbi:hypothetical protein [Longispora albida]|uniref:hypothetical protein n=1 Tax=Longispora albida TaxID=203523 RepID=UPI00037B5C2E|nr:hypothetical protein [Longispora albida]